MLKKKFSGFLKNIKRSYNASKTYKKELNEAILNSVSVNRAKKNNKIINILGTNSNLNNVKSDAMKNNSPKPIKKVTIFVSDKDRTAIDSNSDQIIKKLCEKTYSKLASLETKYGLEHPKCKAFRKIDGLLFFLYQGELSLLEAIQEITKQKKICGDDLNSCMRYGFFGLRQSDTGKVVDSVLNDLTTIYLDSTTKLQLDDIRIQPF